MAATFELELVAADRIVWSGDAVMVIARTVAGEVGILANHAPLLGILTPGSVEIRPDEGRPMFAAVDGGFLSVANNRISILAERAEIGTEIDTSAARETLERLERDGDGSERAKQAVAVAQAWVDTAERAS